MKTIIIGFSRAKSPYKLFSRAIQWAQSTPFSHVYTRFSWPAAGADLIYQASHTSVNFESYEHFKTHALTVAEFTFNVQDENWHKVASFMLSELDKPYSIAEIIGLFIRIIGFKLGLQVPNPFVNGPAAYVCSELGADILKILKPESNLESEQIGPKELYEALNK